MPELIALKFLQPSDLTLFDVIWQRDLAWFRDGQIERVSKQKAINLNAREFLTELYPAVRAAAARGVTRMPLDLTIYGPGGAGPHEVARKVVRSRGSKNWRLNGETIHEPDGEAGRYAGLAQGDLALIKFGGEPQPQSARIALLSGASGEGVLMRDLMRDMDDTGMVLITPLRLAEALRNSGVPQEHPVWLLAADEELEEAVERALEGNPAPLDEIRRRRRRAGGGASLEQYLRARAAAEITGRAGEELVAGWLEENCEFFDWVSSEEPLSPFDMIVKGGPFADELTHLDVKATKRNFSERFHLSMGEAFFASDTDAPYRLVRVYDLRPGEMPKVRISEPINDFARGLLRLHDDAFDEGVAASGFVVLPETQGLVWGPPVEIGEPEEQE